MLNPKNFKRFFAFGCSFTNYIWPTWADLIGREIPVYENWGRGGGGNQFIFNSIIECNQRNQFTKDDLVIVMWTSCSREDRYYQGDWLLATTDYREKVYGKDWVMKFGIEEEGNMIRDFASISAAQQLLTNTTSIHLNSLPMIRFDTDRATQEVKKGNATFDSMEKRWVQAQHNLAHGLVVDEEYLIGKHIIEVYQNIFANIKEPLFDRVLKNPERPNFGDKHPTPYEALDYIKDFIKLDADEFVKEWTDHISLIRTKNNMPVEFIRNPVVRF